MSWTEKAGWGALDGTSIKVVHDGGWDSSSSASGGRGGAGWLLDQHHEVHSPSEVVCDVHVLSTMAPLPVLMMTMREVELSKALTSGPTPAVCVWLKVRRKHSFFLHSVLHHPSRPE